MVSRRVRQEVARRAAGICEYCHFPEAADVIDFEVDHVKPQRHRGGHGTENLAWSCALCNLAKGYNLSGEDPQSGEVVLLFNPRTQQWKRHFKWNGAELVGMTKSGRATVEVLKINDLDRLLTRRELMAAGLYRH